MPTIIINAEALAAQIEGSVKAVRFSPRIESDSFCLIELASGVQIQIHVTRDRREFHDFSIAGLAHLSP
jgi:hypothetical protein